MTENTQDPNDGYEEDFNTWALTQSMRGVLSIDDYDELRDFR